jgi:hypothetical protein
MRACGASRLVFDATDDDWHTSLQCPSDDLDWVGGRAGKKDEENHGT